MQQTIIALIIMVIAFVLFMVEIFPLGMVVISSAIAMAVFGILDFKTALSGFGDDTTMLVLGVSIIGYALFETGVTAKAGDYLKKNFAKNEKMFLIVIIIATCLISAFVSNTATVAMMMPVIGTVAAASDGKIKKRNILMPVAIASGVGGLSTLVGSPSQIIAQGMLIKQGYTPMKFFDLAVVGVPLIILLVMYYATIGYSLNKKIFKGGNETQEVPLNIEADEPVAVDKKTKRKQLISVSVLVVCVIGFVAQIWSLGVIAMGGAVILILTGCITEKQAYHNIDWSTIFVLAGSLGFAQGLNSSGACAWIAKGILGIIGTDVSPFILFSVLIFISMILTSVASNVAMTTMMVTIGIAIANALGLNVTAVVMGIIIGVSLDFSTPIGTPPMTMVYSAGGYKFTDYIKVGGIYNILAYILTIIVIPLVWKL